MSTVAFIRRCLDAGLSIDDALAAADAFEAAPAVPVLTARQERNRRYYDAKRLKASESKTPKTVQDVSDAIKMPPPRVCTRVVTPSLPSLRSEEVKPVSSNEDTPPLKAKCAKPNGFARFWEAYPNKVAKVAAEKAYAKALRSIPGPDPPALILAGVERAKASRAWGEGFIPHPATWLNRGSWDDQPAETNPTPRNANAQRPRTDHRLDAFRDKLLDVGAAMDAAFVQPRRDN